MVLNLTRLKTTLLQGCCQLVMGSQPAHNLVIWLLQGCDNLVGCYNLVIFVWGESVCVCVCARVGINTNGAPGIPLPPPPPHTHTHKLSEILGGAYPHTPLIYTCTYMLLHVIIFPLCEKIPPVCVCDTCMYTMWDTFSTCASSSLS